MPTHPNATCSRDPMRWLRPRRHPSGVAQASRSLTGKFVILAPKSSLWIVLQACVKPRRIQTRRSFLFKETSTYYLEKDACYFLALFMDLKCYMILTFFINTLSFSLVNFFTFLSLFLLRLVHSFQCFGRSLVVSCCHDCFIIRLFFFSI